MSSSEGYVIQKDNQGRYSITLPKALVMALKVKKGDKASWSFEKGKLTLNFE